MYTIPLTIPKTKDEYFQRLQDLLAINERLKKESQPGYDGVEEYKKTEEELRKIAEMLEQEIKNRAILEEQVMQLRNELMKGANAVSEFDSGSAEDNLILSGEREVYVEKRTLSAKTRYEMEIEILTLKKRLLAEKEEEKRLALMKDKLAETRIRAHGILPKWINEMKQVADSSRTLRVKIAKQQTVNPDSLSFRERILFFHSGTVESNLQTGRSGAPRPSWSRQSN